MPTSDLPTSDWAPTLEGVGAKIRTRTVDDLGNELGTFTAATRPTDAQVTDLLGDAAGDVEDVIGGDIPRSFWTRAAALVELRAAMLIELTYFPEQVGTSRSPYNQLKDLFDDRLARLELNIATHPTGDDTEGDGGLAGTGGVEPSMMPSFTFPRNAGGMVGWRTRW